MKSTDSPVILEGIVGSKAYGLDTPDSDEDRLGVYIAPTAAFLGLNPPRDKGSTVQRKDPDETFHEIGKFCRLALKSNPTILELLWLGEYTFVSGVGLQLVNMRQSFLSAPYVRNAYLGYATEQFRRITVRENNDFSSDLKHRTAKHARHLARLLRQGLQLWTTGEMTVKVDDPEWYFEFGEEVQNGHLRHAKLLIKTAEDAFHEASTVLPDEPDFDGVNRALTRIRSSRLVMNASEIIPGQKIFDNLYDL